MPITGVLLTAIGQSGGSQLRRIHYPILLGNLRETKANGFVTLFTLESICRALLMTIVPLHIYALMQDAQKVSIVYSLVSLAGLLLSLGVPMLIHLIARRWMVTIGVVSYIISTILYTQGTIWTVIAALGLQVTGTALLEVIVNLYLLDHIQRKQLNSFEPKRLLFSGMAFMAGPWLGVYINNNIADDLTYVVVAFTALMFLSVFWWLRLSDSSVINAAKRAPPNPIRYIPRFVRQPRLVLAWTLAIGRNGWWLMFFIYTPIYVTTAGYGAEVGGALVSLGVAPMILVRYWGRLGDRIGLRRLLIAGYGLTGVSTIAAGLFADIPFACMALLWLAALMATIVDGAGNVPFLRAVHPHERAEMTSVYSTFRHATSLFTPGLFAIVLVFLPLPYVFVAGGLASLGMAAFSRLLPRRL